METKEKKFSDADFYSVGDHQEYLVHTDWSEAVGEHFDSSAELGEHIKKQCERLAPLTVIAWKKRDLNRAWPADMVERFIDELIEADNMADSWWENYGDFDGDYPPIQAKKPEAQEALKKLKEEMTDLLFNHMKEHTHIFQNNVHCEREFSLEELQEFAKENHWEEWEKELTE